MNRGQTSVGGQAFPANRTPYWSTATELLPQAEYVPGELLKAIMLCWSGRVKLMWCRFRPDDCHDEDYANRVPHSDVVCVARLSVTWRTYPGKCADAAQ